MKFRSIFILLFLLSSYTVLYGQNDTRRPRSNINNIKIRALVNEDIFINEIPQLVDTNRLFIFSADTLACNMISKTEKQAIRETYKHWRYGITVGMGIRIAPISSSKLDEDVYKRRKSLRNGFYIGFDGGHFLSENVGIGIKYELFKSTHTVDVFSGSLPYYDDFTGKITDNINIHYISPALLLRSINKSKMIQAFCDVSVGYTIYNHKNKLNDEVFNIRGGNFGFSSTVGVDFMLNKKRNSSVGLNFSIVAASIKEVKIDGSKFHLNKEDIENISRITFGLNFRLHR